MNEFLEDAKSALNELKKRPERLLIMANLYQETEQKNQEAAGKLDKNVIT